MDDKNKDIIDEEELRQEIEEYRKFAIKKSIVELDVGVILATAFTKVVNAVSECLLMPIVNAVLGYAGGSWREWTIEWFSMKLELGKLLGVSLDFLITAIVLYIIYKKIIF